MERPPIVAAALREEEGSSMTRYASENETADIAFLGPAGTYCDAAAHAFATRIGLEDASLLPCRSFRRVFDAVEGGHAEYGVVAIENSIEGPVTSTLDSFAARSSAVILGEQIVDIRHCLLVHPDADPQGIAAIASHPQALAQCRRYLEANYLTTPVQTARSTADAARMAMEDPTIAAIANERAADLLGARIMERGIEDHADDQTSFALIARNGHAPVFTQEGPMKTSVALYLHDDRPGALQMILSEFAYGGINLTKIQSRPTKRKLGDYMFFIDFAGSVDEPSVSVALDCLRLKLREVKVLGCYPAFRGNHA